MFSRFASNAVYAKARSMYRNRLNEQNYLDLLACGSVPEIASYLKTRTVYSQALENITASSVHRGWLESNLKKMMFYKYESLCKYELSVGEKFYEYFFALSDIDQILRCIRLLNTGHPEEYIFEVSDFFNSHSNLDLYAIAKIKSYGELLEALTGSPYRDILEPFAPDKEGGQVNFTAIETALNKYLYTQMYNLIKKNFIGKARKELIDVLSRQIDMRNIANIYRMKRFFNADADSVKEAVITLTSKLSQQQIDSMISAPDADALMKLIEKSPYAKSFSTGQFSYIENTAQKVLYSDSKKKLRYSVYPAVVMLSYIFLSQNELTNIIHIIEGTRYDIPSEEIRKMLIGVGD